MECTGTNLKETSTADVMVAYVGSGFLKKSTVHYCAEAPNSELSFRTIHSANQLSIFGVILIWCDELTQQIRGQSFLSMEKSVAKVNDQLCRKLELEEVNTLARTVRTSVQAAMDRPRTHQEK